MAKHGKNYTRAVSDTGEEIGALGRDCGHHCGVLLVGHAGQHEAHCSCKECHDTK